MIITVHYRFMKKASYYIFLLCLLITAPILAQNDRAILEFKDGKQRKGLAKLIGGDQVKFKKAKGQKAEKFHFSELQKVVIYENEEPSTYIYIETREGRFNVVKELEIGAVNLYVLEQKGYSPPMQMAGANGHMNMTGGNFYDIKNLYVKRGENGELTHLGSNQLFSKNFKKAASDYFSNCPKLVNKIQNRDFKKKHVKDIVHYYNTKCDL